jgi:hypothetical protein
MFPVKELIRFLVAHSIISKETVRVLIGWFLYVPLVVAPIVTVGVLLYGLRKMTTHAIAIMNLIFASGAFLLFVVGESGCRWAGSPPSRPHPPMTVREIMMDAVVFFWFAGACGLFFKRRLAWIGSVIGVGLAVSLIAAGLITIIVACVYPDAEMERLKDIGNGGYLFALVFGVTESSIALAMCLRLLLGLFQMRKDVFAGS